MSEEFILCDFSTGIDDMKRADQKDTVKVLRVLAKSKRFSIFEATANHGIATTMTRLMHKRLTLVDPDGIRHEYGILLKRTGGDYPWTNIELTEGGKRLLEDHP